MLEIRFNIVEQTEGIRKAARGRLTKPALKNAWAVWLRRFFPRHFKMEAFHRYPGIYKRRRTRKPKDPRPLVETGGLWAQLLQSAKITGTGKKSTLRMRGTAYLRVRRAGHPDKAAEVGAVNLNELIYLRKIIGRSVHAGIVSARGTKRYRVQGGQTRG